MVNWQERSWNKFSTRYFSFLLFFSFLLDDNNSISSETTRFDNEIFPSFRNHQVQKNKDLKVSLGPGLYYKHKVRDTVSAEKCHQSFSNDKVRFSIEICIEI